MPILDFLKKKTSDQQNQPPSSPVHDQQPSQTTTKTTTQTMTGGSSGPTAYSGIGNPPGGQAYSGIGNPPSGKLYSGIGNPLTSSLQQNSEQAGQVPSTYKQNISTSTQQSSQSQSPKAQIPQPPTLLSTDQPNLSTDNKQVQYDLMTHLTQRSNRVFITAQNKATELNNDYIDSEHLLHGLLSDPEIYKFFIEIKIQPQIIEQELAKIYKRGQNQKNPQPSPRLKRIIDQALIIARKIGYEFISPEHILLSLYEESEGAGAQILTKLGLKKDQLNKKIVGKKEGFDKETGQKTQRSALGQYAIDLTAKASIGQLDPVVERSDVIERVIHILSRRTKNNPALIGEAGVGKTAIVEGLAQKIVKKEVPEPLLNKKILQLDLMSILAGASHRGEFEERMKKIIEEIIASHGQIILFIDEIHNIVGAGAGGESSLDASNFLKPSLARGELQMIGATTITEYRRYIEKDPALERRFQPVLVQEPTEEQAIKMLKSLRDKYEAFHRVKIPDEAIESAVKLSKRYVGDRFLPDKGVDLIDEAASAVRLPLISLPEEIRSAEERINQLNQELEEATKTGNKVKVGILKPKIDDLDVDLKQKKAEFQLKKSQTTTVVSDSVIKDVISRWTGIPITKISESETEKLTQLEKIMHKRLIDQEYAVEVVAAAIRRGRAGLKSSARPIGSFIFLGPTGVGKTELAKTLAEVLFGQEEAMIRFDMTEYMEKHEVAKLLGAPPGYVGYEEGGKLTEAVRRRPYCVVLFDEIEKAHPDIFNILLQILDDGRLTDNKGHTISFKNSVAICTSNIGTKIIQDELILEGKTDIEEPEVLSTYTFSPRGRQIMTIMGKIFEKDNPSGKWLSKMMIDYFAGQKIDDSTVEKTNRKTPSQFPGREFDTHAISSKGVEVITVKDQVFTKTATTAKIWQLQTLIDYFKDNLVINALPDVPEQQLPTAYLKTHTFTPQESEIVTFGDRYWIKKEETKEWQTGTLKEYFKNQKINQKKTSQETNLDNAKNKKGQEQPKTFPINYWDIHTFNPDGTEIIIVADSMWIKPKSGQNWEISTLKDYFGSEFPLDKELQEKQKIETELSKNQYEKIKNKVMSKLRDFMRPELINRFDDIIIFEPLKYQHMLKIAELQFQNLKKILEDQNVGFSWTKAAIKEIVRAGFDPIYGARPLKRTIQKLIENPISTLLIEKKVTEGNMILLDFDGNNFVFNIQKVELIPESDLTDQVTRQFICQKCAAVTKTKVVKNSIPICSQCGSSNIQEMISKQDIKKTEAKKLPSDKTENILNTQDKKDANKKFENPQSQKTDKNPSLDNQNQRADTQKITNQNFDRTNENIKTVKNQPDLKTL